MLDPLKTKIYLNISTLVFPLLQKKTSCTHFKEQKFNPLNAELNPICHLLALLGAHHILHVSMMRIKELIAVHFKKNVEIFI
jgi:hypothetical protein